MVVDYRMLNRVTVRKVFIIPNSDQIKSNVAGSIWLSVGDAKEGFNQVENEAGSDVKMAVLTVSGTWIPRGLTFGPTNGPEDFQELVFIIFARRLYREWFLFIDDLSIFLCLCLSASLVYFLFVLLIKNTKALHCLLFMY